MEELLTGPVLEHVVLPLATVVITALIGWIASLVRKWTGIEVEAKRRQALQSALMNGVRYAIQQLSTGGKIVDLSSDEWRERLIEESMDYIESSVPDALEYFHVWGRDALRRLVLPKIPLPGEIAELPVMTEKQALEHNEKITGVKQTSIPTRKAKTS